jgi:hypothetical protein
LLGIWNDTFHDAGGNEFVGRSIRRLLRSAGVENVGMKVHVEVAKVGEYRRTHLLSLLQSMEDSVVASGRITKTELKRHMAALSEHLADPETTLIDKLVVSGLGPEGEINLRSSPRPLNVRYGNKADITIVLNHVRFRGLSRRQADEPLYPSMSDFTVRPHTASVTHRN